MSMAEARAAYKPPEEKRAFVRFMARTLTGAHSAPFPAFIPPCNPSPRAKPPAGPRGPAAT